MDGVNSRIKTEDTDSMIDQEDEDRPESTNKNKLLSNTIESQYKIEEIDSSSIKQEEMINKQDFTNTEFSCDICLKHFKNGQALRRHKTIHTVDKNCSVCGKTFYSKKVMNVHMRKVHLKEFRHSCSECEYKTDITQVFEVHARTHTGEKPHKCQHCEKSFNDPSSLIYHTKLTHTKQGVKCCEMCGKGFLGQSQLERHQITHTRSARKGPIEYSSEFKSFAVKEADEFGILGTAKKHGIGPTAMQYCGHTALRLAFFTGYGSNKVVQ